VTKRRSDVPVFLLYAGIIHAIGLALLLPMLITLPGPDRESAPVPETPAVGVVVLPPPQPLTDVGPERTSALPSASGVGEGKARGAAAPVAAEPKIRQEKKDDNAGVAPAGPEAKPAQQQTEPAHEEPKPAEAADGAKDAVAHVGPDAEAQTESGPQVQPADAEPQGKAREADKPAKQETETQETGPAKASVEAKDTLPAKAAPRTARKSSARRNTAKAAPGRKASRTAKSQTKFAPFNGALSGLLSPPAKKRR
jgi:hypothetical protein